MVKIANALTISEIEQILYAKNPHTRPAPGTPRGSSAGETATATVGKHMILRRTSYSFGSPSPADLVGRF